MPADRSWHSDLYQSERPSSYLAPKLYVGGFLKIMHRRGFIFTATAVRYTLNDIRSFFLPSYSLDANITINPAITMPMGKHPNGGK